MFEAEYTKRFTKEFERFRKYDKETTAKIKILVVDTLEHPMEGLGRPERKLVVETYRQKEPPSL